MFDFCQHFYLIIISFTLFCFTSHPNDQIGNFCSTPLTYRTFYNMRTLNYKTQLTMCFAAVNHYGEQPIDHKNVETDKVDQNQPIAVFEC